MYRSLVGLLATLGLVATSCTESDPGAEADTSSRAVETVDAVDGCSDGWTDPEDLDPNRDVARCESGAPAPKPLEERAEVVVSTSTLNAEYIAALMYGIDQGEFDRENLDVTFEVLPPSDSYALLSQGQIDATWTSPDAAFVNAVASGFDLRWVLGNFGPAEGSQSGLWVRAEDGEALPLEEVASQPIGTIVGKGSVISYPISQAFGEADVELSDLEFQQMPAADLVSALQNGALQSAWLLDPLWTPLVDDPSLEFVHGQTAGEPLGGLVVGARLLREEPEVGQAFVRAYLRTINTYLTDDYKQDPEVVTRIAELLDIPADTVEATPSLVWDWEIRGGTMQRLQEAFIEGGTVELETPLPEDELVDRSLYESVVGHTDGD